MIYRRRLQARRGLGVIYRRRATSAKRSWCDIQEEGLQARRGLGVIYRRRATSAKRSWCDIQEEGYKREEVLV